MNTTKYFKVERPSAPTPCQAIPAKAIVRILILFLLALAIPYQLQAAGPAPLNLLSNTNFVVLAETTITTTGGGSINGNIGLSPAPGSAILVTCAQVTGTIYATDASGPLPCRVVDTTLLNQAVNDMMTSYTDAAGRTPVPTGSNLNPGAAFSTGYNMGGLTLAPGLYKFGSGQTAFINTDVTLSGSPSDVWIFQCGADLQVANNVHVILAGGANANNIFWQVSTKAVIGTTAVFNGTILAGTSITMNTGSTMNGRALAQAQVTFNGTGAALPITAPVIAVLNPLGANLANGNTNDFGSLAVGTNTSHTFTITNTGSANLTVSGISIDGGDAASFTVTSIPLAPVSPGGTAAFTVRYAPAGSGAKNATLHIASNDSTNNPFNIVLTGNSANNGFPIIGVQQPLGTNLTNGVGTNNFGSVAVGTNASLTFTITNSGSANLTGLVITIDGSNSVLFTVTTNPVASVNPGNITAFTVRFAPVSTGVKIAVLHIGNNDTNNNPFNIALTGTGTGASLVPGIVVQQPNGTNLTSNVSTNNFGSIAVGTNASHTFIITNIGTTNLTGLVITIDGTNAAMFSVTTNPVAPLNPGSNTTFTVSFTPVSTGVKTAVLHITNNDPNNNPFNIALIGTGTNASIIVSTNLLGTVGSTITLNPQTGLFEQTVLVTNTSSTTIAGVRLFILSLPADVLVYNASGSTNGIPFVQYNLPLAPGATVSFLIEYYRANRNANIQPTFFAEEIIPVSVTVTGAVLTINSTNLISGRFLIEFTATPGRTYAVQYSSNLLDWATAIPNIVAPANRVQWFDDGPPKTESLPSTVGSRFYQVIELP